MNKVFLIGRTTEQPMLKSTSTGTPVTSFSIGVKRRFASDKSDFPTIVCWNKLAENCAKYLERGQQIAVSGELQSRQYEDKNGNKRIAWDVVAEDVVFLAKASGSGSSREREEAQSEDELLSDDALPF